MFWKIGCIYGLTSVAAGAFGAHGLKTRISDPSKLASWSTAAQYQVCPPLLPLVSCALQCEVISPGPVNLPISSKMRYTTYSTVSNHFQQLIHSGILLLATSIAPKNKLAAGFFVAGMTMFSGSIYLLVLDPQRFKALGPVTPLGGLCLMALAFGSRGRLVA